MVKVYTKENCPPCKATKRKLDKEGIAFEEVPLESTPGASDYIKSLGYMQAPVVITPEDSWSGYIPGKIVELAAVRTPELIKEG